MKMLKKKQYFTCVDFVHDSVSGADHGSNCFRKQCIKSVHLC